MVPSVDQQMRVAEKSAGQAALSTKLRDQAIPIVKLVFGK
jgi:hypothetical protein